MSSSRFAVVWRGVVTVIVLPLSFLASQFISGASGPLGAKLALDQVDGGTQEYLVVKMFTSFDWAFLPFYSAVAFVVVVWVGYALQVVNNNES